MRVYEIFRSVNGEVCKSGQGSFTTFLRLAGCNLRCSYCDTEYAQDVVSGKEKPASDIIKEIESLGNRRVTITGGEPLLQAEELIKLVKVLWHRGFEMTVETNGSVDFTNFGYVQSWVVDYKLPSSCMNSHMVDFSKFEYLGSNDWVKFVVGDSGDLLTAIWAMSKISEISNASFAFSPVYGEMDTEFIMNYLYSENIHTKYPLRLFLNVQIHKIAGVK